jgi:hypothetical protein
MSHFTVMVMGEEPEKQLAPYHEFECTGVDDEYVQDVDITDEVRGEISKDGKTLVQALGWYGLEDRIVEHESMVDRANGHKYGYAVVRNGELVKAIDRTNPNKKWDWYQLGGRWTGLLKLRIGFDGEAGDHGLMTNRAKPGYVDQARKGAVDFDGMRAEAEAKARDEYRRFHALIGDTPPPRTWAEIRAQHEGNIEAARAAYQQQPAIKLLVADDHFRWEDSPERFLCSEDEFAQKARDAAIVTFAIVKDGSWYERGRMGWWACVSNEKERDEWNREFSKLLDGVDDGTLISVFDCHI